MKTYTGPTLRLLMKSMVGIRSDPFRDTRLVAEALFQALAGRQGMR